MNRIVQGLAALVAVTFGYFTSMNQALVGAMVGAGAARGRQAVNQSSVPGILCGWLIGSGAGFVATFLLALLVGAVTPGRPRAAG